MRIWEWFLMCVFTYVGIRYLIDMIRFALGYEINGKKRKPVIEIRRSVPKEIQKEAPAAYEWEELLKIG